MDLRVKHEDDRVGMDSRIKSENGMFGSELREGLEGRRASTAGALAPRTMTVREP